MSSKNDDDDDDDILMNIQKLIFLSLLVFARDDMNENLIYNYSLIESKFLKFYTAKCDYFENLNSKMKLCETGFTYHVSIVVI